MLNITINTEGDFFTIYGVYNYLKIYLEGKELNGNDDFNGIIEWNGIDLRMYRMCGKAFNKDDRFRINIEGEYSYDDVYGIFTLLGEVIARCRNIRLIKKTPL